MKFHTTQEELDLTIEQAKNIGNHDGMQAVVTVRKLSPRARKTSYGFHFEKTDSVLVGDVQELDDGSVRRIEAIL